VKAKTTKKAKPRYASVSEPGLGWETQLAMRGRQLPALDKRIKEAYEGREVALQLTLLLANSEVPKFLPHIWLL
jgi:hypothetical protein